MSERSTATMERQIWDLLPNEVAVRELKAVPMSPRHVHATLPFGYESIRKAMHRMRTDGVLAMERDGREFLYSQKEGANPPFDGRGGRR